MVSKQDIIDEVKKCEEDPAYFIRNYVMIEHPIKGIIPFDLYKFQEKIISEIEGNRFNIVRKFRQAGITTICAAYSLWSIIFKDNHNVMVVSIGDRESTAFLRRVVMMYDDLPKWLQPGIVEKNKHSLYLSTGSRVKSQPAGAGRGESVSHLIVDEAAFIDKMREFWAAIYPTISTGGKASLISTVNGMSNLYYELYRDAEQKNNSFNVVDLHWREHPDYTEQWAKENKPIIGPRMWEQEYECSFLGTGDTFIDRHTLATLNSTVNPKYFSKYSDSLRIWKEPDPYGEYLLSVDSSYGRDKDYSAFHIINLYNGEQVAEFYSNKTPISEFARIIQTEGLNYNLAHVIVERNGLGIPLLQELFENLEYENIWMDDRQEFGFQMTSKSRESVLNSLEEVLRSSSFKINSERTVSELNTFVITETGKIEADKNYHDDLVMSLALASEVYKNLQINLPSDLGKSTESKTKPEIPSSVWVSTNGAATEEDTSWILK
tara:strand:+ start:4216 stop:5688 length:1473 start_codon:yes stop_codon:yes gene_type:complete